MPTIHDATALRLDGPVDRVYAGRDRVWPPRPAPVFVDTFTREATGGALGTADTGQVWEAANVGWSITAGRLAAAATSIVHVPTGLPSAAGEYEADVQHSSSTGRFAGIMFAALPGSTDRWEFIADARDDFLTLRRRSNSTTTVAVQVTQAITTTLMHLRVRFDPAAATIQGWLGYGATPAITYTLTAAEVTKYTPAVRWGVTTGSAAAVYFDNLTARPLT